MSQTPNLQLLAEIDDIIRTAPPESDIDNKAIIVPWLGRAIATIKRWDTTFGILSSLDRNRILEGVALTSRPPFYKILAQLHEARHSLLMQIPGTGNLAINKGMVFDYFDEIRKIIESAGKEIFLIDPYLDAEFVSRYLPHARASVAIRLLASKRLKTLLPAVAEFAKQQTSRIDVRSSSDFHDRYIFVDGNSCYQSGASFKDGAKSSPTTLTQIVDAFPAMKRTYEELWAKATIER